MPTNRNQAMRHAFEALPVTVLGTQVGKLVYGVLVRNANRQVNRKGTNGGTSK